MPIDYDHLSDVDIDGIEAILDALRKYDLSEDDIRSDGYNFDFNYNNSHVHFCVQSERLVGDIISIDESKIHNAGPKACKIEDEPVGWAKYVKYNGLKEFCIWGGLETIDKVMELAKTPIEQYVADKIEERLQLKAAVKAGVEVSSRKRRGLITYWSKELFKELYENYLSSPEFAKLRNDVAMV